MFFAIVPPDAAIRALRATREELRALGSGRFVRDDRLHITLCFLGEQDENGLARAAAALTKAAEHFSPVVLRLDRLDSFGRVAVARVGGELAALADALGENRSFKPHITLARDYQRPARWPDIEPVEWTAREIVLFESVLGARSVYIARHTALLGGKI